MKKSLASIIFILLFIATATSSVNASTEQKVSNYYHVLDEAGLRPFLHFVKGNLTDSSSKVFIFGRRPINKFENISYDEHELQPFTFLLSSQFTNNQIQEVSSTMDVVIVCDSDFEVLNRFTCSKNSIFANSNLYTIPTDRRDINYYKDSNLLVFPEIYWVDSSDKDVVISFISSIYKTKAVLKNLPETSRENSVLTQLLAIKDSFLDELILYLFTVVTLVTIVYITYNKNVVLLKFKSFTVEFLQYIAKNLFTFFTLFIVTLFVWLVTFIPVLLMSGVHTTNLTILTDFFKETHLGLLYGISITPFQKLYLLLGIFLLVSMALLITSILLSRYFVVSKNIIFTRKLLDANFKKSFLVSSYFSSLIFLVLFTLSSSLVVIFTLLLLSVLVLFYSKNDRGLALNRREKVLIMLFLTIFLVFSLAGVFMKESLVEKKYAKEDLFGVTDKIVTLPYVKEYGKSVTFHPHKIQTKTSIFVDDFLVYFPGYSNIVNTNVSNFNPKSSYILQVPNSEQTYAELLLKDEALYNYLILKGEKNSRYFKVQKYADAMRFEFDCTYAGNTYKEIDLQLFYIMDAHYKTTDINFMNFYGCSDSEELVQYDLPLYLEGFESESIIIGFLDVEELNGVDNYFFVFEDAKYSPSKFPDTLEKKILAQDLKSSSKITNYGFDFDESIESSNSEDISPIINDLVKSGKLPSPFVVWSGEGNIIIRNKYDSTKN